MIFNQGAHISEEFFNEALNNYDIALFCATDRHRGLNFVSILYANATLHTSY